MARVFEPNDPELSKRKMRRIRRTDLERISQVQLDIHRGLLRALPEVAFEPGFLRKVRRCVGDATQMDIDLWLHSIEVLKRSHLRGEIPGTTCIAVIGLQPLSDKILVEMDLRFVYKAIDRLLGGHGLSVDMHRPLTEIEQGVYTYLLLKIIALYQQEYVNPEQIALRLDDIRHDIKSCADVVRLDEHWLNIVWKMNFDLDVSYVRTLVPSGLARQAWFTKPPRGSALMKRHHERIRRRMNRLEGITVEARIEAGRIELAESDIAALDPGDIILLEQPQITLSGDSISGQATMKVGSGRRGVLSGQIKTQGNQIVFEIAEIETFEEPSEYDPSQEHAEASSPEDAVAEIEDEPTDDEADDGNVSMDDVIDEDYGIDDENEGDEEEEFEEEETGGEYEDEELPIDDDDNLAESEPLLGDMPVSVVVELGRVQLTADEVIRLRAGQVIEMGRSPGDPIDLVVGGRLLAKGELVEIEGALGVKILNLVKGNE